MSVSELQALTQRFADAFDKQIIASTSLGRVGQPEDIAPVAVFLASDDAGWLTGEAIFANGGHK
jgi:3-oxoacyl-[acyl-carrier protein] reductase